MDRDWARLGAALKAAREDLGLEQQQVAEQIGVKRGALRNIEIGDFSRVTPTVRTYARIVGWTEASIDTVLSGGDPTKVAAPSEESATVVTGTPEELPLRIQAALAADGPVLDTAVISLFGAEGADDDVQMVVVVKGRSTATPEQIHKALLQWERTEAQIRRSGSQ
ncbi:helix-turn-helix domain-containing protein [Streptomyces brevispora]|uniref:helix-turn-helix domain-containing protein n=1 Tax=Streptomyces brevispora TaxID=887462 RepID=UPI002E380139|nr:helix-turn-helix domain-containing protein [Streptomyces brevispora]